MIKGDFMRILAALSQASSWCSDAYRDIQVFGISLGIGMLINKKIDAKIPDKYKEIVSYAAALKVSGIASLILPSFPYYDHSVSISGGLACNAIDYATQRGIASVTNEMFSQQISQIRRISNASGITSGGIIFGVSSAPLWATTAIALGTGMIVGYRTANYLTQLKVNQFQLLKA